MYGHKWTSVHGVEVDKEGVWAKGLKGVSPREIADGLNLIVTGGDKWPPGTPEFRKLCLFGIDTPHQRAFQKQAMLCKGLPILPASKDFGKDAIKKIREKMNNG